MIRFLLFFIFPSAIHCCLVVKSVEPRKCIQWYKHTQTRSIPAKCECPYLALDKYNIQSHKAGQNWYESNPTDVLLLPPKIQVDDCSITVQCSEEDYSLRIFGGKRNYDLGYYAANALCDSSNQTWLLDDNSGFLRSIETIDAVCWKDICSCPIQQVDEFLVPEYINFYPVYLDYLFQFELYKPSFEMDYCPTEIRCPENMQKALISQDEFLEGGSKFRCEKDDKGRPIWEVTRDGEDKVRFKSYYLYATCINRDLGGVKPPSGTGVCYCDHAFLDPDSQNGDKLMNFDTRIEEHSERCEWYLYCRYPTNIARTVINGKIVKSKSFHATCNADTKLWSITNNEEVFENQPVFFHDCVEL
ncbi:hypothetical protein CRE_26802 [Caenorhabditis remanei]|uniref:Uncharacterized protein n=1 Tax=Caenorhabditis remanei TaxID=31234 RepID=E3NGB4_CAERE|nr:hypothetical protein CRE_26802 [Caenorhabditis remanei]